MLVYTMQQKLLVMSRTDKGVYKACESLRAVFQGSRVFATEKLILMITKKW